jgi:hypothetical protein
MAVNLREPAPGKNVNDEEEGNQPLESRKRVLLDRWVEKYHIQRNSAVLDCLARLPGELALSVVADRFEQQMRCISSVRNPTGMLISTCGLHKELCRDAAKASRLA